MLKQSIFVVSTLFGLIGTSPAVAFVPPETVYIDGQPCGSFCQAYMAWAQAYRGQSAAQSVAPAQRSVKPSSRHSSESSEPTRRAPFRSNGLARTRLSKQERPPGVRQNQPTIIRTQANDMQNRDMPNGGSPAAQSNTPVKPMTESSPTVDNAGPGAVSVQQNVVAATGVAEQLTDATAATEGKPTGFAASDLTGSRAETTASIPTGVGHLVAIIFARPEIESVSELSGKDIAIIEKQSASSGSIRSAIVAAGAADVQLSDTGQTSAIDGVISGKVPAAVIALLSKDTADTFPAIAGFKIFRVPLSPQ